MRIAIDARSLEGNKTGVGRYLENLLKVWQGKKDQEFILYFKDEIPQEGYLRSDNFRLKKLENPLGFSSNFFFQHLLLPYSLWKGRADFFFSPFYLKPLFCPVRSAIVLHDISYEAHPEWFDRKSQFVLKTLSKLSAKGADVIFTPSRYSKEEIVRRYGIAAVKIVVTPLAPDASFRKETDEERIRKVKERYDLSRYVLSVGTMFTRRHIPEIIAAFGRFSQENPGYQLLIVGKNKTFPYADIDKLIEEENARGGQKRLFRTDSVPEEELRVLYSGASAVIYLSDYEGFGLPVVEAQYFDVPVITSRNTSLIEVGGDSVEFAADNGPDAVLASFRKVLGEEAYRELLVRKGRENLRRFDWQACADSTLSTIKELRKA